MVGCICDEAVCVRSRMYVRSGIAYVGVTAIRCVLVGVSVKWSCGWQGV